jgi:hypothetical protein
VLSAETGELPGLADRLRPGTGDLLIAIERPPPERDLLAVGVAGEGFLRGDPPAETCLLTGSCDEGPRGAVLLSRG